MASAVRAITQQDFDRAARHFNADHCPKSSAQTAPPFQGRLEMFTLPSGFRVAHGDFLSLRPTVQTSRADRSVDISVLFQPTDVAFQLDRRRLRAPHGSVTMLCLTFPRCSR